MAVNGYDFIFLMTAIRTCRRICDELYSRTDLWVASLSDTAGRGHRGGHASGHATDR